ncbi:hypothetical protein EYF80_024410 [Liparis tanakae]|uniref:Uncharacterized protein n=1 Tax=Liparis tanakae TaxID=230148 RepID=A0A4Z2HKD1_9TELE|nr:hypothetical protein EYF80_024410 [Liparis tanakae]
MRRGDGGSTKDQLAQYAAAFHQHSKSGGETRAYLDVEVDFSTPAQSIASAILGSTGPLAKFPRTIFFNMKAGISQKLEAERGEETLTVSATTGRKCRAHRDDPVAPSRQRQHLLEEHLRRPTDRGEEDDGTPDALWAGVIQRPHLTVIVVDDNLVDADNTRRQQQYTEPLLLNGIQEEEEEGEEVEVEEED